MSVIKKLEERIRNNPKDVKFADIVKLLEHYGFENKTINGSHHNFIHPDLEQSITEMVTLPKKKDLVKSVYIEKALAKIDKLVGM